MSETREQRRRRGAIADEQADRVSLVCNNVVITAATICALIRRIHDRSRINGTAGKLLHVKGVLSVFQE